MNNVWYVLISISVAAFVGGVTNHLAIKMLFHPLREVRVFGKKLPFTPGLIPKRQNEIAKSLGKMVTTHLVTKDGLESMLAKPDFRLKLETKLTAVVEDYAGRDETLEQFMLRYMTPERLEAWKSTLALWLKDQTTQTAVRLWESKGLADLPLGSILPEWSALKREEAAQYATVMLLQQVKQELDTVEGNRLLRTITTQFLEQAGGFLGALAGIFMDEDKAVAKVKAAVVKQLESPAVYKLIHDFVARKMAEIEKVTLGSAITLLTKKESSEWVKDYASQAINWTVLLDRCFVIRLSELLAPRKAWLLSQIPFAVAYGTDMLGRNVGRMMEGIQLSDIVEEEVSKFPIEQVEEIILSLSGKEFAAITWLGVFLGGIIGLFQSIFLLWLR